MDSSLSTILKINYPEVFSGSDNYSNFIFSMDNGWYSIVDALCESFVNLSRQKYTAYQYLRSFQGQRRHPSGSIITQENIDDAYKDWKKANDEIPKIIELKEKYGSLRIASTASLPIHHELIKMAQAMSERTCEVCGLTGPIVLTYHLSWNKTLCPNHADEKYGLDAKNYREKNLK